MLVHITFILLIICSIYLIYGAWFRDFGKKICQANERLPIMFNWSWPKSERGSTIAMKFLAVTILIASVLGEILIIVL
jgi:hypothetical protein